MFAFLRCLSYASYFPLEKNAFILSHKQDEMDDNFENYVNDPIFCFLSERFLLY